MGVVTAVALGVFGKNAVTPAAIARNLVIFVACYLFVFAMGFVVNLFRAPALLDQERMLEITALQGTIKAEQNQSALLKERIDKQLWPDARPKLILERWGPRVAGTIVQAERGFYIANHGEQTALDVTVDGFTVGGRKWISKTIPSIQSKREALALLWKDSCPSGENKWDLDTSLRSVASSKTADYEMPVRVRYRDFNKNWYLTTATLRLLGTGATEFGPPTQDKLGSSA